jgi:penicillin-binding protein 1A
MFLSNKQTIWRKIREAFISFQLERHFTKRQILQLYLNNMYFGRGIYGVEAACRRFWNKSVLDVSIDEAATLAAVAKSARLYSPLNAPDGAKRRRNINLRSMFRLGFISYEQYQELIKKELVIQDYTPGNKIRLYIKERIRQWAEKLWGRDVLYRKGLKIKTTINKKKQALAEKLFCKKVEELRVKIGDQLNGGMLSIDPNTGKIRVSIGGYDFRESQFNRAFQAVRQMGSSFKPIVYTAAILSGLELDTVMVDEPVEMELPGCSKTWRPKNWTRRFDGEMTLARALSFSNNVITIKTLLKTGVKNVVNLSRKFGITRALSEYPSLALGTAEATVEENVSAFNVFANNGIYVKPYMVEWVRDKWGKKLWETMPERRKVLDGKTNSKMVNALSLRLKRTEKIVGAGNWINAEAIGKTGSTNEAATTWYVGATPGLTTAIYLGRDDNKPLGRYVFGSQTAYPVWVEFYRKIDFAKKQFYIDPGLREMVIDWVTGYPTFDLHGKNTVTILG